MPEYKWDLQTDDLKWNTMISAGSDLDPPRTHTQQDFRPPWKVSKPPPLRGNFVKIPWFWYISLKRPISQNSRGFFGNFEISAPFSRRKLSPPKCWPPTTRSTPSTRGSGVAESLNTQSMCFSAHQPNDMSTQTHPTCLRADCFFFSVSSSTTLSLTLFQLSLFSSYNHTHTTVRLYTYQFDQVHLEVTLGKA